MPRQAIGLRFFPASPRTTSTNCRVPVVPQNSRDVTTNPRFEVVPPLAARTGSGQGAEDHRGGVRALEPRRVGGGPDVRFGFGGPWGAAAVGDVWLDHARAESALRRIVGGVDLAGIIAEREKLISR